MSLRDAILGSDASSRTRLAALALAVAITVALTATVGVYVLDAETVGPVDATVNTTVDDENRTVTFTVEEIGDAESFRLRGEGIDGEEVLLGALDDAGDSMTLDAGETLADEGDVNVIVSDGDSEYTVSSVEWNWSDDADTTANAAVNTTVGDDSSDGGTVSAAVSTDVDDDARAVTLTVADAGPADAFVLRGDGVEGDELELDLEDAGDATTVGADDGLDPDRGAATIVAIDGERESAVGRFEWDWTTDDGSPTESQ